MNKSHTAFTYEVSYSAEFGEGYVTIEAKNKQEADRKIDEWCKKNFAVSSTSASGCGPKPRLVSSGHLVKNTDAIENIKALIDKCDEEAVLEEGEAKDWFYGKINGLRDAISLLEHEE